VTSRIFAISKSLKQYQIADLEAPVDLAVLGTVRVGDAAVEVVDPVADYVALMREIFDFGSLRSFVAQAGSSFKVLIDSMHGGARSGWRAPPLTRRAQ
jgi:phosphoglucomutase